MKKRCQGGKYFSHHPLAGMLNHGTEGTGEWLSMQLRGGNTGSEPASRSHHLQPDSAGTIVRRISFRSANLSPHQLSRRRPQVLGMAHHPGTALFHSVAFTVTEVDAEMLPLRPKEEWTQAYNSDECECDGALLPKPP